MRFKYSIIIPHHNTSSMLSRMLKSIPEREDTQIVVVDDHSDTSEVEALKRLIHINLELCFLPENHGAGYARNIGLEKVLGEWTLVVDADDVFAENTFDVFDKNVDENLDLLCFCAKCFDASTGKISKYKDMSDESVRMFIQKETKYSRNRFRYRNTVCWNKLVKTDFLRKNNIKFEDCQVNNDVYYALQVCHKAKNIKVIPDELYCYMINDNSITHKKRTIEREFLFYIQVQKRNGLYKALGLNGYPFYRPTYLYIPFLIKKKGICGMIGFFKYLNIHREEVLEARKSYLSILE